jgi:hypothetical protein
VGLLTTVDDVKQLNDDVFAALQKAGDGAVICADHRRVAPLSAEVASLWSSAMRRTNQNIARSGVLLDPSNVLFNLQLERVVLCARSDLRRLFEDAESMRAWLAEALRSDSEREALRAILAPQDP